MGFEKSHLFGKVEVDVAATAAGTFALSTDIPGGAGMAQRFSFTIPITARRPVSSRLPGSMQGHYVSCKYTPGAGQSELYGVRIWCRELPDGQWDWMSISVVPTGLEYEPIPLPIEATPVEYSPVPLPIEPTPVEYSALPLPIEPTPPTYSPVPLPIEATPVEYSPVPLPVEPTPAEYSAIRLPVEPTPDTYSPSPLPIEATPAEYSPVKLPIEQTPMEFSELKLPVKATPPVPEWVGVPVDE